MDEIAVDALYQGIKSRELTTIFVFYHSKNYLVAYQLLLQHAQAEVMNKMKDEKATKKIPAFPTLVDPQNRKRNNDNRTVESRPNNCNDKINRNDDGLSPLNK